MTIRLNCQIKFSRRKKTTKNPPKNIGSFAIRREQSEDRSDYANAQTDPSLLPAHMSEGTLSHVADPMKHGIVQTISTKRELSNLDSRDLEKIKTLTCRPLVVSA